MKREPQKKENIPHRIMQLRWELAFSKSESRKQEIMNEIDTYEQQVLDAAQSVDEHASD